MSASTTPSLRLRVFAWSLALLAMAGVAGGLGFIKYQEITQAIAAAGEMPEQVESIEAVAVTAGEWSASSRAVGTVVALKQVMLMNELPGVVAEVGFKSGDRVEKDHLMVRLDTRQEQADLSAAKAEAELARLTLDRRTRMKANVSDSDIDSARAELTAARARVARLEVAIAKQSIRAPFRARVGLSDLQPGAYLDTGSLIAELQGVADDAYVDFALPQDQCALLKPGVSVALSGAALPGGLQGTLTAINATVDARARTVRLRALVPGLGKLLAPGSFVDVSAVVAAPRPVRYIPLTALRRSSYGDHVFVLVEKEGAVRATQRPVVAGPVQGENIVIEHGLETGERIASTGSFKLREGLKVNVVAEAKAP